MQRQITDLQVQIKDIAAKSRMLLLTQIKEKHLMHYSNSLMMRKIRLRGATRVPIVPPLDSSQGAAQSGRIVLTISYQRHRMLKL